MYVTVSFNVITNTSPKFTVLHESKNVSVILCICMCTPAILSKMGKVITKLSGRLGVMLRLTHSCKEAFIILNYACLQEFGNPKEKHKYRHPMIINCY